MKEKIKKIIKKILLVILIIIGGSIVAGIIQEEIGYGFLHGLVVFGMSMGILKVTGIWDFFKKKNNK